MINKLGMPITYFTFPRFSFKNRISSACTLEFSNVHSCQMELQHILNTVLQNTFKMWAKPYLIVYLSLSSLIAGSLAILLSLNIPPNKTFISLHELFEWPGDTDFKANLCQFSIC